MPRNNGYPWPDSRGDVLHPCRPLHGLRTRARTATTPSARPSSRVGVTHHERIVHGPITACPALRAVVSGLDDAVDHLLLVHQADVRQQRRGDVVGMKASCARCAREEMRPRSRAVSDMLAPRGSCPRPERVHAHAKRPPASGVPCTVYLTSGTHRWKVGAVLVGIPR